VATHVGTAGWNIPRTQRDKFQTEGSQLARYASRLNAAEINSSFHRPHAPAIYERWAATVPPAFRFSVKMPKLISHERLLAGTREPLDRFLGEVSGLGDKLGPLLLQLPPAFAFDARRAGRFFELLRRRHDGAVACEPRHATWTGDAAGRLLDKFGVARVAADPARAPGLEAPGGWGGLSYYRWHGSPRVYFSSYAQEALASLASAVRGTPTGSETWCIFDNTASGSAAGNALELDTIIQDGG
jgi:uncharacterized protein YecE (DUF72 family)